MEQSIIHTLISVGALGISIYLALEVSSLRNNMYFLKSKMDDILKEKEGDCDDKKIYQKNPWKKTRNEYDL